MFKRLLGLKSLWVTLVFLCGGLWRVSSWQGSFRLPTAQELVVDFVLLPLLVCVALWLISVAVRRLNSESTSAVAANSNQERVKNPPSATELEIRDVEYRLPIGDSMPEPAQPRVQDGLTAKNKAPARAAWVNDVSADDFLSLAPEGSKKLTCDVKRALLLASEVLQAVALRHMEQGSASADLQVHFLSPARWSVITSNLAEQWLIDLSASWEMPSVRLQVRTRPVSGALDALTYLNELNTQINDDQDGRAHVLVVSDSFIGKGLVRRWDKEKRLYGSDRRDGVIPGEGACALLLCKPSVTELNRPLARISTADIRHCDPSIAPPDNQLSGLIKSQGSRAFEVGAVISDANHCVSRQGEVTNLLHTFFPDLDPVADSFALSVGCGEMAAVTPIAALALAAHQSALLQKSVVVVSFQDAARKAMVLVHPPSEEV